jgi:hypothetical protein
MEPLIAKLSDSIKFRCLDVISINYDTFIAEKFIEEAKCFDKI